MVLSMSRTKINEHKKIIELIHENHDCWVKITEKEHIPLLRKYVIRLIGKVNTFYNNPEENVIK